MPESAGRPGNRLVEGHDRVDGLQKPVNLGIGRTSASTLGYSDRRNDDCRARKDCATKDPSRYFFFRRDR